MIGARSRSGSKSHRQEDSYSKTQSSSYDPSDMPGTTSYLNATPMSRDGSASSRTSTNTFGPSSNIHSYQYRNHMDGLPAANDHSGSNYASARASPIGPPPSGSLPQLPSDIGMAYSTRPVTALYDGLPSLPSDGERYATSTSRAPGHPFAYPSPDPNDGESQVNEERFYTARSDASTSRAGSNGYSEKRRPATSSPPTASSPQTIYPNASHSIRHPPPATGLPPLPNGHRPSGSNTTDTSAEDALSALGYMHGNAEDFPKSSAGSSRTLQTSPSTSYPQAEMRRDSRDRTHSQATTVGTNTETANGSSSGMPSKSVLTVALQKAQSAVLLDSAGNEQAAIQAYEQSIRLLRQVMQRVEESAGNWRAREMEKLDQLRERRRERRKSGRMGADSDASGEGSQPYLGHEEEETAEERKERERREQKLLKREKMRLDESRRLKVIHDTYEERIRVLTIDVEERARIDQLSKQALERELALEASQRNAYKFPIGQLPNTPPSESKSEQMPLNALNHTKVSVSARQSALPFPISPRSRPSDGHTSVEQTPPPTIPIPHITPINLGSTFADMPNFGSSPDIEAEREKIKRRSLGATNTSTARTKSILSFSPDSDDMHHTDKFAKQMSEPQRVLGEAHTIKPGHVKQGSTASVASRQSPASRSAAVFASTEAQKHSGSPNDRRRLHMGMSHHATDEEEEIESPHNSFGGQGSSSAAIEKVNEMERGDLHNEVLATPTLGSASTNGYLPMHSRQQSAASPPDKVRSRAGSQAGSATHSSALRHVTSQDSLSSAASGSATGPWLAQPGHQMPMPPGIDHVDRSSGPPLVPLSAQRQSAVAINVTGRQGRSASLAQTASMSAASKANDNSLLVNPSTAHGTISRRRRSPNPSEDYTSTSRVTRSRPELPRSISTENRQDLQNVGTISKPASESETEATTSTTTRNPAVSQPVSHARTSSQQSKNTPPLPSSAFSSTTSASQEAGSMPRNPPKIEPAIHYLQRIDEANSISPTAVAAAYAQEGYQDRRKEYAAAGYDASGSFLEPETPASTSFGSVMPPTLLDAVDMTPLDQRQGYVAPPLSQIRMPFHFMRQLRQSIQTGGYITPRLYIPKQLWTQGGIKLLHLETKVRVIDLLLAGLESLEKVGEPLISTDTLAPVAVRASTSEKLIRELDSFESLLEEAQSTLSKKLSFIEVSGGKKTGHNSFSTWGSKLSRSMDKMTKTKNFDAPETYVAAISRLCVHAQVLDRHICALQPEFESTESLATRARSGTINASQSSKAQDAYSELHQDVRRQIENRLRRSSEFFAKVLAKVILSDLNIWLDKYSKRAAGWTVD